MNTANAESNIMYTVNAQNFAKIPGSPIAYWLSFHMFELFAEQKLTEYGITRLGMTTGENARFVRLWHEVEASRECFTAQSQDALDKERNKYWVPYNKGGEYRKWYGNNDCVVFWKDQGQAIKNFADEKTGRIRSTVPNTEYYFLPCASWSKISCGRIAFRYKDHSIFDVAGACLFADSEKLFYLMALLNSNVVMTMLKAMSPTLNFEGGQISSIPVIICVSQIRDYIAATAHENIEISKTDWDSFETSWDFKKHPLI